MNMKLVALGGTILGFAAGAVAGYFVSTKRLEDRYAEVAEKEILEAREYYAAFYKKDDYATPGGALAKRVPKRPEGVDDSTAENSVSTESLKRMVEGLKYKEPDPDAEEKPARILIDSGDNMVVADPDNPYLITEEMFMRNTDNYSIVSLTWYEDEVLLDEDETIIHDVEATVGYANLNRFGEGTDNPNIVFVRNERLEVNYEIKRHHGSYAADVAGLIPDISTKYQPRRR